MAKHLIEQNGLTQDSLEAALSTDTYYVSTIVTAQSYTGTASDLNVLGGNSVLVTEGTETYDDPTGVPLRVELQFDGVTSFNYFHCNYAYYKVGGGATTHEVNLEIWNYDLSQWDTLMAPIVADEEILESYTFTAVDGGQEYISDDANERVRVRFNHIDNGITSHRLNIDHAIIYRGIIGVPNESHTGLSGRSEPDQHPTSAITGLDSTLSTLLDTTAHEAIDHTSILGVPNSPDDIGAMPNTHGTDNHVPSGFIEHNTTSLSLTENVGGVNDTFTVTLTGTNYPVYINGTKYTLSTDSVTQVGATSRRYYIYLDTSNDLVISTSSWDLESATYDGSAPVCTVLWDAIIHKGILEEERHYSWRDVKWHHWAHHTIGTRYAYAHANYLGLVRPATGGTNYQTIDISSGAIYDEDISNELGQQTTCRVFWGDDSGMYFENAASTFAYKTSATATPGIVTDVPYYFRKDTNALVAVTGNNSTGHFVSWVYATNAYSDPKIAVVIDQRDTTTGMTIAQARAAASPVFPVDFVLEWKLIYKFIFLRNAGGTTSFVESADYRTVSSLPAAGTPSAVNIVASAVAWAGPYGDLSSTTVQTVIEELEDEKVAKATYDAHTVLYATTDNTPVALTVSEQTVVGRATGGNISAIAIDSDLSSVSANDDTVPSAKATKAMGDLKLALAGGTMTGSITSDDAVGAITLVEQGTMTVNTTGSATDKYSGITIVGKAGYTAGSGAFGDLIYLDPTDSRWEKVDISAAAAADGDARAILGINLTDAPTDGNDINILMMGAVRADNAFPTFTVGAPVYASTTGDVVVAQPTTTDYVIRIVGHALTTDQLWFNPDATWTTHT